MNKDEIAMNYKKELKKRISADYERRVKQWMAADPSQLIDAAEEITAARLIRDNIEDAINEEDARFLLGLDEPLDELADRWIAENGLDASHGEELLHCVWTLREELSDDAGPCTVRDFLAAHVGGVFSLITPCGFVPLTAAQAEGLMSGQSAAAHPGVPGITMSLSADDLLGQAVNSANYANGVWHLLTESPEMKQCGPEMGGMQ